MPCPWCRKDLDFRVLAAGEDGGAAGWGSQGFERGATISCDFCGRKSKIIGIDQLVIVTLRRTGG